MARPKAGAPTKYNPKFHPEDFIKQSKAGKEVTQIASSWDVHRDTVYEWAKVHKIFSDAFRLGKQHRDAFWLNLGWAGMTGTASINGQKTKIDFAFYKYLTMARLGWTDNATNQEADSELDLDVTPYGKT